MTASPRVKYRFNFSSDPYLLVQELSRCWRDLDLPVEEGLDELKSLCTRQVSGDATSIARSRPDGMNEITRAGFMR